MARSRDLFRVRTVSIRQQGTFVQRLWPNFKYRVERGKLICGGIIQPTAVSRPYRVRVEYRAKQRPQVWVEDPVLRRRQASPDQPIPHTFNSRDPGREQPCLYYKDWRSDRLLAHTIIPWLYEWLAFYELWHLTGKWLGGGIHHGNGKKR